MRTAILIHGRPDKDEYYNSNVPSMSNNHWFPWLSKQLMVHDIFTIAPEIPLPWQPRYNIWKKELERFEITHETMLIGHSCGSGFIVRWLSENMDKKVGRVVLVAPWLNPENNPVSDTADFFDFAIDEDIVDRTDGITIFYSDDDQETIKKSVNILKNKIKGLTYKEFHNYGHFCYNDLKTDAFPELLDELIGK